MKSMTGYGRGEALHNGLKLAVEVNSLNRKQIEVGVSLPRDLELLEVPIREEIARKISRGRINVRVSLQASSDKGAAATRLNKDLARAFAKEIEGLGRELGWEGGWSVDTLLRIPGVLETRENVQDPTEWLPSLQKALRLALSELVSMREKEGAVLAKDLFKRTNNMRKAVNRIQKRSAFVLKRYREQLVERLQNAGLPGVTIDDERVLKEIVLFADRCDVSEEITRLQSHFEQFQTYAEAKEPVGRTLDFLAQEMNREINTIGSKANDTQISHEVVTLKTELEKFREQVQNVE